MDACIYSDIDPKTDIHMETEMESNIDFGFYFNTSTVMYACLGINSGCELKHNSQYIKYLRFLFLFSQRFAFGRGLSAVRTAEICRFLGAGK